MAHKNRFENPNKINMENLLILEILVKQLFFSDLLDKNGYNQLDGTRLSGNLNFISSALSWNNC